MLCAQHPGSASEEHRDGVRILRQGGRLGVYAATLRRLRALERTEGGFDVVIDTQNGLPFAAPLATRSPVVVLVHHVHREQWPIVFGPVTAKVGWTIESRVSPRFYRGHQYVAVSQETRSELAELGVDPADVTAEMRSKVKAMSYGLAYGLSAFGLSKQLGISTGEAQGLMDEYFARFGGVRDYLRDVVVEAGKQGYTETMFGRRRYLPDLTSDNRQRREMAERMALNAPIQGSAADIMKVAMLGVDRELTASGARSRMLLQVHDELVLEVASGEREDLEALVRQEMGSAARMDVPLDVSVGVGRSWHEAAH